MFWLQKSIVLYLCVRFGRRYVFFAFLPVKYHSSKIDAHISNTEFRIYPNKRWTCISWLTIHSILASSDFSHSSHVEWKTTTLDLANIVNLHSMDRSNAWFSRKAQSNRLKNAYSSFKTDHQPTIGPLFSDVWI